MMMFYSSERGEITRQPLTALIEIRMLDFHIRPRVR